MGSEHMYLTGLIIIGLLTLFFGLGAATLTVALRNEWVMGLVEEARGYWDNLDLHDFARKKRDKALIVAILLVSALSIFLSQAPT